MSDIEQLKEFAREVIRMAWEGQDGFEDVQEMALRFGLIEPDVGGYNPEKHGESEYDADPGDDWYVFAPLLGTNPGTEEKAR